MVFANSVSSIMRQHEEDDTLLDGVMRERASNYAATSALQRADELRHLEAVDHLPENLLDTQLQSAAIIGDMRAASKGFDADIWNQAYDRRVLADEKLPGKVRRQILDMAASEGVRTGELAGKGFISKRKPNRGSLFDVMEAPANKRH